MYKKGKGMRMANRSGLEKWRRLVLDNRKTLSIDRDMGWGFPSVPLLFTLFIVCTIAAHLVRSHD